MKNKPWTQEELEYVRDCRERLKPVSYSDIAKALGRSAGVCQLKYHYYFGDHKRNDEMLPANITICWLCKHTNRYDCTWFDPDNPQPVDGWIAEEETRNYINTPPHRHYYVTYKVSHCPKFVAEDPEYYARWRERHKTKKVGECRSTK